MTSYTTPNVSTDLTVAAPGVLANDTDLEGNALTAAVVLAPAHGALTLNANGGFTYTPAANYNGADSFTYKANDGSLDSNVATVTLTITKQTPTITWTNPTAITYGTPLGASQLNATARVSGSPVPGTFTYTPAPGTVLGAGLNQTLNVTFTPADAARFNSAASTAQITVSQAAASVTPNAASKTYGSVDPAFTGTLSGFLASDGVTATYSRTTGDTVTGGPYTISATLSPASALANYTITSNTAAFTITTKPASVTPAAASKTYGAADPALTGTLIGFVAADSVTVTYSRTAGETVAGSPYAISATLSPAKKRGRGVIKPLHDQRNAQSCERARELRHHVQHGGVHHHGEDRLGDAGGGEQDLRSSGSGADGHAEWLCGRRRRDGDLQPDGWRDCRGQPVHD